MPDDIPPDLAASLSDRYEPRRLLGRGGMANVYLADDCKHRRQVALKVLLPGLTAFLGVERFLKEIQIAAHLTHPHILALYDSGEAGGFLYYVMPYVDGGSLRQELVGGPTKLTFERIVDGEVPETEYLVLVEEIRRVVGQLGQVNQLGRSFSWTLARGQGQRNLEVAVTIRGGRTRITKIGRAHV